MVSNSSRKQTKRNLTQNTPNLNRLIWYIRKHLFGVYSGFILLIAAAFRFYDYGHRWTLASDQAGFALVARYAIDTLQIPLLGPFSSAGPFQTGGEWYWMVMIGQLLFFNTLMGPWIFMTVLSVLFVLLMILLGEKLVNKNFGLLVGLFTALSTGQIIQSPNLTNQTPLMLFSAAALLCAVLYSRKKSRRYIFLLGLSVGVASSIHLQGVAMVPIVLLTLLVNRVIHWKDYGILILGGLIPWLPVIYVDVQNDFYTFSNMLEYYLYNPNQISYEALGRRWLTFIGIFIPSAWSYTIGGNIWIGYALIGLSGILFLISIFRKTMNKEWVIIFVSAAIMIVMLRYTRTPIFESYFVFMHPLILLISAWCIYSIYTKYKIIGIILMLVVALTSISRNITEIAKQSTTFPSGIAHMSDYLLSEYPDKNFAIYDYRYRTTLASQPLALYLYDQNRLDTDGQRIGVVAIYNKKNKDTITDTPLPFKGGVSLIDLSSSSSAELKRHEWSLVNASEVYNNVQNWYK